MHRTLVFYKELTPMGRVASQFEFGDPARGPSKVRSHLITLGRKRLHYNIRVYPRRRAARRVIITGFATSKVRKAKNGEEVAIDMVAQLYDEKGLDVIDVDTIEDLDTQHEVKLALRKKRIIEKDDVVHFCGGPPSGKPVF